MPWEYCEKCRSEIADWREGLEGCHRCGWTYYDFDDTDVKEVIDRLIEEIDELNEKVQYFDRLEEWLWDNHHEKCPHRQRSQRQGMGDGCNLSISHDCGRHDCHTFPQRKEVM